MANSHEKWRSRIGRLAQGATEGDSHDEHAEDRPGRRRRTPARPGARALEEAAGASDAEQQATGFVERVQTPGRDWMIVARQLIAILRRLRKPHRRTWAPGDELPTPPPTKMADQ